jgi:hypothetical protein
VHALLGELLLAQGHLDAAVDAYAHALRANAQHPEARFGMAVASARKNHAVGELDRVVASLRDDGTLTAQMEQQATAAKAAAAMATDSP